MKFSDAWDELMDGKKIARSGWNGKNLFIFKVNGSEFKVNREPLLSIFGEGYDIEYHPHVDMKAADGSIFVWTPNQLDLFADDWEVLI